MAHRPHETRPVGFAKEMLTRATLAVALAGAVAAPAGAASKPYDLSGDGRQDLVVGLPWVAESGKPGLGAVAVFEGSRSELFGDVEVLTRESLGFPGEPGNYVLTGNGTASGDFDGDGTADLAVGLPGEGSTGAVGIVYGSRGFPGTRRETLFGPPPAEGQRVTNFGYTLVAGDVNRDGFADLAVGDVAADRRQNYDRGSGVVYLMYGSASGLTETGRVELDRPKPRYDAFGMHLALGDTNSDGLPDLYEGFEGAPVYFDDPPEPGHFSVGRNEKGAFAGVGRVNGGMKGGPTSIAIGDVDGDRYRDIVLGVPVDGYAGEDDPVPSGSVEIYLGGRTHLIGVPIVLKQDTPGIPGSDQQGDAFGSSVAVARVDGDRYADIVVGAPGEDGGRGRVTVIRGSRSGYAERGNFAIDENTAGVPGRRATGHRFGSKLSLLDLNGDGRSELVVTAPGADSEEGTVTALRGVKGGFTGKGSRRLRLRSLGFAPSPNSGYWPEARIGRDGSS